MSEEEPEAHALPYYTKYLAERIALDDRNQYFITTHNPYFLMAVLEKAPRREAAVFVTYLEGTETRVARLSDDKIEELMDMGADVEKLLGIEPECRLDLDVDTHRAVV